MLTGCMSRIVAQVLSTYENPWTRNCGTDDNILLLLLIFKSFVPLSFSLQSCKADKADTDDGHVTIGKCSLVD